MTECCPLCAASADLYYRDDQRSYRQCTRCNLVFVPPRYFLSRDDEYAYYCLHENTPEDPGYRRFLSRLAEPLKERLPPASSGLDFGCGPAPALAALLREGGHRVALYDSFFRDDADLLQQPYGFVCATEVVEHLHQPGAVLQQLWEMLSAGGWLGVMTKLVRDREAFARWHYIRDPTHVCFFSRPTWEWWAREQAASVEFVGADVILLQKLGA